MSTGARLAVPYYLALKAEVLYLAHHTSEALETIAEAETLAERFEERWWCAEMHRLRGVFLAVIGGDETKIHASFHNAIRTAREQQSVSLAKRAEASYAEYRNQKMNASGEGGFIVSVDSFATPALITRAAPKTRKKFFEVFTVPIRNANI
jgi:hypothetical protein